MNELTPKQINVFEILTGEGFDYEVARQIAIDTNGDLNKARVAASDYKYRNSSKNQNEM